MGYRDEWEDCKIQQTLLHTRYQRQIVAEAEATITQLTPVIQQAKARKQAALQQMQDAPHTNNTIEPTKKHTQRTAPRNSRVRQPKKTSIADMFFIGLFILALVALVVFVGLYVMRKMLILWKNFYDEPRNQNLC